MKPVSESDLHCYLDGQLGNAARREEVEAWLETHPEEAARLGDYALIERHLQERFQPVLDEPVPERLAVAATRRAPTGRWRRVAASIGWLTLGSVLGWSWGAFDNRSPRPLSVERSLVRPALLAHVVYTPEVRHPVEVTAAQEQHLVTWLSKRLGAEVRAPQLGELGYQLVGGRLLPGEDGAPAAQFMYEDAGGQRLTLYVRASDGGATPSAFRYQVSNGVGVFYWIDDQLAYALSGRIEREPLLAAARIAYTALNP